MTADASLAKKHSKELPPEEITSPALEKSALLRPLTRVGFFFVIDSDLFTSLLFRFLFSARSNCTGIESASSPNSDRMPITMGDPLLVATHSPGNRLENVWLQEEGL